MTLVVGIGTGLFSLAILWVLGVALCLLLSRSGKQSAVFGVGILLVVLSAVMISWPRENKDEVVAPIDEEKVDMIAIPRTIYAVFITLFVLVAFVLFMVDHVLMQNLATAAKAKKSYTF